MADDVNPQGKVSAEEAYAAAAEAVPVKIEPPVKEPVARPAPEVIELPPRAKRVQAMEQAAVPVNATAPKAVVPKAVAPKRPAPKASGGAVRQVKAQPAPRAKVSPKVPVAPQSKETAMEKSSDFVEGAQKAAEKGSALFADYAEFAKGNFEAIIESGRILTAGLRGIGSTIATEGKAAVETLTTDAKDLVSVKSPGELLKLQADILRRNIDNAVTLSTRNGQTAMRVASDSFAPISARLGLAVEKLKQVA